MSQNIVDKNIDTLYNEIEKLKNNITSLQTSINSNNTAIADLQNKNYYYYDWPFFSLETGKSASKTVSFNCTGKPIVILFKVNHNTINSHSWSKITIAKNSTIVSISACEGFNISDNEDSIAIYLDSEKKIGVINYTFTITSYTDNTSYADEGATPKIIIFEI